MLPRPPMFASDSEFAAAVLLDADPFADITNTAAIRAVMANGRYFDRAALDRLLADARAEVLKASPPPNLNLYGQKGD